MSYKLANNTFDGLNLMYVTNSPEPHMPKVTLYADGFLSAMFKSLKSSVLYSFYRIFAAPMPTIR